MVMTSVSPGQGIYTLQNSREIAYDNGNIMCCQQYFALKGVAGIT